MPTTIKVGVGAKVNQKIKCITERQCRDDDAGHDLLQENWGEWRAERLSRSPDMRPGNDTLTRAFASLMSGTNNDCHDIYSCADRNQSKVTSGGFGSKDSLKDEGGWQLTRFPELSCWHSRKVRYIHKDVQNEDNDERDGSDSLEQRKGILLEF